MDVKKIAVICLSIVMIAIIFGMMYLETQNDVIIETHYELETDDFSYDGEELIVHNIIIEDAEDVECYEGILKYTVQDKNGSGGMYLELMVFPLIMIPGMMFFILIFVDD